MLTSFLSTVAKVMSLLQMREPRLRHLDATWNKIPKGPVVGTGTYNPFAHSCELPGASGILLYGLSDTNVSGAHGDLGPSPP